MSFRLRLPVLVWAALAVGLAGLLGFAILARGSDMRNDFTTTPRDPPRFEAVAALPDNAGRDLDYPNSRNEEPAIHPLSVPGLKPDPVAVLARVTQAAESMAGWDIVGIDPERLRIEAVATTSWLKFKDDVVIEIRSMVASDGTVSEAGKSATPEITPNPAVGTLLQVHMRSKSRRGRSDFGANRKRVALFFERLEAGFED